MRPDRFPFLYEASLLTLPWAGVGVIHLAVGIDVGAGLQLSWLLLAVATAVAAAGGIRTDGPHGAFLAVTREMPRPVRWGTLAALAALLFSGAGMILARVQEPADVVFWRWVRQVVQLLIMGFFVLWPALHARGPRRWRTTARLLLAAVLVQAVYGLLQGISFYQPNPLYAGLERIFTSNPSILSGSEQLYLRNVFRDVPRLRGTVCEPLYLGNFLLMALPWIVLGPLGARTRILGGAAGFLLLVGTWSRGAWFGLAVQILLALLILAFRARHSSVGGGWNRCRILRAAGWVLVALAAATVTTGLIFGPDALLMPAERLAQSFSSQDWSNLTRMYSMQAAWRTFQLSPVVGVGWGQFAWHFPVVVDPHGLDSQFDWPMVNNFPLQILCETGALGALVFLGMVAALALAVVRRLRADRPPHPALVPAAISVAGVWTQLLTFSQYNLPHIWVALGLLLAALADDRSEDMADMADMADAAKGAEA